MKRRLLLPILSLVLALATLASCASGTLEEFSSEIESTLGIESDSEGNSAETEGKNEETSTDGGKEDVENNSKDAYYIIEAVAGYGRNGLANGWKYDNRFDLTNITDLDSSMLYDISDEKFYRLIRDFDAENNGVLKLEMIVSAQSTSEAVYIALCGDNDERVLYLTPKNGVWVLVGAEELVTEIAIESGASTFKYGIELIIDLEANTAELTMNNIYCGKISIADKALERLIIGTEKVGKGTIGFEYVRLIKNYPIVDRFILGDVADYEGQTPAGWDITGDFALDRINSMRLYDMYSVLADSKAGSVSSAKKTFSKVSGVVSFETMILLPEKVDGARVSMLSGDSDVITFETRDGKICVGDEVLNDYTANVWQTLHVDADTVSGKAKIYVNGKLRATVDFDADHIDGVRVDFAPEKDAEMWFDDIEVYEIIKHNDYPEEPKVAESTDYNVGMNVCWLWRDQQSGEGWDSVSPFAEFDTYLGYFDEGLRETADWELKWMAEHGVDFVHVCWYAPSENLQAPIKEMRHSYSALHDGYMMAEYSDLVDFCIMWENNAVDAYSFEQFRDYIWSYWCEYYFSDERYATLDNKAIISVWNRANLETTFGGREEALAAMEWMEEDIKRYGYDGIVFLAQTQGQLVSEDYKSIAAMGYDATYAYHWGAKGYDEKHQIKCNKGNTKMSEGIMHHIPTASIGFNDVGRNETRDPIVSVEGHLEVLEAMKSLLEGSKKGDWRDNTIFLSTWNEFSEGTYMFPTASTGFDYLENVRKVFTNDTEDHSDVDVKPTQAQIDRVTHLYPDNYSPIRWYQFEEQDREEGAYGVNVNGLKLSFTFNPTIADDGDYIVVGEEKGKGFYSMMRLFPEWDRYTGDGVLTLHSYLEHTYVFKVGSDKVTVDGVERDLGFTFTIRDGLPQFHLKKLCDLLGYSYTVEEGVLMVQACADEEYENLKNKPENQWEFNITGELEGWKIQQGAATVENGGTLIVTPSGIDIAVHRDVNFEAGRYTVVKMGIKYNKAVVSSEALLFFKTKDSPAFDSDKVVTARYDVEGKGEGDIVEVVFVLSNSSNFNGTVTGIRIDPFTGLDSFEIDYIRFEMDDSYALENNVVEIDDENQWNFDGNTAEGWAIYNASLIGVENGVLSAKSTNTDPYIIKSVSFRASKYHVMIVAMKYRSNLEGVIPRFYFTTETGEKWSDERYVDGLIRIPEGVIEGDTVFAVFNLADCKSWNGTVTGLRIDPISDAGKFEIDSVSFYQRKGMEMNGVPATRPTEVIISDASSVPEGITVNSAGGATLQIVDDPKESGNKVFKVQCTNGNGDGSVYCYLNVNMHFLPGETYTITYKIMPLTDYNGVAFSNTIIGGNLRYGTLADPIKDHTFDGSANKSTSGEWIEVKVTVKIPANYTAADGDCFQIWGKFSPSSQLGINYLVKDISITLSE